MARDITNHREGRKALPDTERCYRAIVAAEPYDKRRSKAKSLAEDMARRVDHSRLVKLLGAIAWDEGDGVLAAELSDLQEARRLFGDHDDRRPLPVYMGPLDASLGFSERAA